MYKTILYVVVGAHALLVVLMAVSIPMLLINQPWYVSIPLSVWIINLSILPVRCPLTTIENRLRKKLGMPIIAGFIKHYMGIIRRK